MNKYFLTSILVIMISVSAIAQKKIKSWNKNQVIAHRGAWKTLNLPENSIASLKQAFAIGCYGSEFDVQITSDSITVVNHNADFLGKDIATSTYQELVDYKKLSNGESIPTLEEYIKTGMTQKKTKLILEIKTQKTPEAEILIAKKVLEQVHQLKAEQWIEYISFSANICKYLIENEKGARVSYLNGELSPEQLKAQKYYGLDYNSKVLKANKEWISQSKELGLITNVWTVNSEKDMDYFLQQAVNYITTNEPELLLKKLDH